MKNANLANYTNKTETEKKDLAADERRYTQIKKWEH